MRISIFSSSLIFSLFVCKGINVYLIIIQKSLIKFCFFTYLNIQDPKFCFISYISLSEKKYLRNEQVEVFLSICDSFYCH